MEAFEPCAIVVVDEGGKEGIALGVALEPVLAVVSRGRVLGADDLGEASVDAFDHAVGLRAIGPGEAMTDAIAGAATTWRNPRRVVIEEAVAMGLRRTVENSASRQRCFGDQAHRR